MTIPNFGPLHHAPLDPDGREADAAGNARVEVITCSHCDAELVGERNDGEARLRPGQWDR
jgi:hypothetical protein